MKITKLLNNYIIKGFDEVSDFELEAEILSCFLDNNSRLIFGCKWRIVDLYNIDNENMSEEIRKMYKELAGFMIQDEENDTRIKAQKSFIDEKTVFTNNEWPFPWEAPNKEVAETIWFSPKDKSEIVKAMKIDEFYNCIVLNINSEFNKLSYAIGVSEDVDGVSMIVITKNEKQFVNIVIPKIQKLISNLVIDDTNFI